MNTVLTFIKEIFTKAKCDFCYKRFDRKDLLDFTVASPYSTNVFYTCRNCDPHKRNEKET